MPRRVRIDPLSGSSLLIEPFFKEQALATATGFTIELAGGYYLITNWHVVSGRNPDTNSCLDRNASVPDRLIVSFHRKNSLGAWVRLEIPLLSVDGAPLWIEHPLGSIVDVVALPLEMSADIEIYPLDVSLARTDVVVSPAMPVSVIGFPLGLRAGENWPIWKTGHVASDPDVDFQADRPAFLIDATTRPGMSGAPVILRLTGGYDTSDGGHVIGGGMTTKFLGVYAGRIHDDSEIGRVWRPFVIQEILSRKLIFSEESGRMPPNRNTRCPCGKGIRFKKCCGSES